MAEPNQVTIYEKLTMVSYFQALTRILVYPGNFFKELSNEANFIQPFGCLIISGLFFAGASATLIHENVISMIGILLLNAILMPVITALMSFVIIRIIGVKGVDFTRIFSVYAYSTSITLMISWIPLFPLITEPWRWTLVFLGLTKGCRLRTIEAFIAMGITVSILIFFFWALGLFISYAKAM